MRIIVTQKDIEKAKYAKKTSASWCGHWCPLAQSFMRRFPKLNVSVTPDSAIVGEPCGEHVSYTMPQVAKEFIRRFDGEHEVQPITFTV